MQWLPADRDDSAGTQATGDKYTARERAMIEQLAGQRVTRAALTVLFPNRSPGAVKQRIIAERHRQGLITSKATGKQKHPADRKTMLPPDAEPLYDDWPITNRAAQTAANGPFLAALLALA